jgi:hypothetical protein
LEPTLEYGYRDLEATQQFRRKIDPNFKFTAEDLRLPIRLLNLRRDSQTNKAALNRISAMLMKGQTVEARTALDQITKG